MVLTIQVREMSGIELGRSAEVTITPAKPAPVAKGRR
jgi:hypothetical protein